MSTKRAKKAAPPPPPRYPKVIEVFGEPYLSNLESPAHATPDCFNGIVNIRRYRITIEEVSEPVEVLRERLMKLWRLDDNHHHFGPLQHAAQQLGMERLDLDLHGIDNPKTWRGQEALRKAKETT